jgi:hypothetical protein
MSAAGGAVSLGRGSDDGARSVTGIPPATTVQTDQLMDGHASMQIERRIGPEEAVASIASQRLFVFRAAGFHDTKQPTPGGKPCLLGKGP